MPYTDRNVNSLSWELDTEIKFQEIPKGGLPNPSYTVLLLAAGIAENGQNRHAK